MDTHEIKIGRVYACAKPANLGGLLNDRMVKWISSDRMFVQYDGPAVAFGRRYPKVSMGKFAAWAFRDVTDQMPVDAWRPAPACSRRVRRQWEIDPGKVL